MPRRPNVIPSVKLTTNIPLDVMNQLNAHLYSPTEGCVPRGAYQKFFVERIREYLAQTQGPSNAPPGNQSED